ncbi:hypothetical protein EY052_22205 [Shigella flexneri]|nr:hypothetical protein [Shigella flexneri]
MEHLCCSEVSISPLFRWPNSVCHFRYPDRLPLTGYAQGVFRQHAKIPLRINLLTSQHDKPALRLFSLRCILSR